MCWHRWLVVGPNCVAGTGPACPVLAAPLRPSVLLLRQCAADQSSNVRRCNPTSANPLCAACCARLAVEGSGFLYKQVRHMAGALLAVGFGRLDPQRIQQLLALSPEESPAGRSTREARGAQHCPWLLCALRILLVESHPVGYRAARSAGAAASSLLCCAALC